MTTNKSFSVAMADEGTKCERCVHYEKGKMPEPCVSCTWYKHFKEKNVKLPRVSTLG